MVKFNTLLLLLLMQPIYAATLDLHLSDTQVEMGKSLVATFTYHGDEKPNEINLSAWHDNFYIEQQDPNHAISPTGQAITTFKSRLYPRSTGLKTLDAIALGGSFVRPKKVTVKPSIRNNIDATPQLLPLKKYYWADESIDISINIPLHFPGNEVIANEWIIEGMTILPLPSLRSESNVQLRWLIYTPFKGLKRFEYPAITQRGQGRFRYHLPLFETTIRPLPSYYPNSIATGLIDLNSRIVTINDKKSLEIKLSKSGYLPEHIEGLDRFLIDLSKNDLYLEKSVNETVKDGVTTRTYLHELPEWLILNPLKFKILFFNTDTKQLDSIEHKLPGVTTLPSYAKYGFITFALLIFIFLFKIILDVVKKIQSKGRLRNAINNAASIKELRKIIHSDFLKTDRSKTEIKHFNQVKLFVSSELEPLYFQQQYVTHDQLKQLKEQLNKLL